MINFGLIYGMSSFGLAKALGIDNQAAKNYIERYFERFAGVRHYMDQTRAQAKAQGYVETVFGRRRLPARDQQPQRSAPRRRRARRDQRADAGHGGRPDQDEHGRGAGRARCTGAGHARDHAGARRTGVRAARIRAGLGQGRGAAPDGGVAELRVPLLAEVGVGPTGSRRIDSVLPWREFVPAGYGKLPAFHYHSWQNAMQSRGKE